VELVERGLLEQDAFLAEAELIQKYGKISDGTGSLVNWTDGGENELGSQIAFDIPMPGKQKAYEETNFVVIKGVERKRFGDDLIDCVDKTSERLDALYAAERANDVDNVRSQFLTPLADDADDFWRRKISCKDMAFGIDEAIGGLEFLEEWGYSIESSRDLLKEFLRELIVLRQRLGERRPKRKPMGEAERLRTVKVLEKALEILRRSQRERGFEQH
jgi:hypothetical protein